MTTPYHALAAAVLSDAAREQAVRRSGARTLAHARTLCSLAALDRVALPVHDPATLQALWTAPVALNPAAREPFQIGRVA